MTNHNLAKKDVYWAYESMLGRKPEADSVAVDWSASGKSLNDLIDYISASQEFKDVAIKRANQNARTDGIIRMNRGRLIKFLLLISIFVLLEVLAIEYFIVSHPVFRDFWGRS